MYYAVVINKGAGRPIRYYARSNEYKRGENREIEWTEDLSKALILESREWIYKVYEEVREKTGRTDLDILNLFC